MPVLLHEEVEELVGLSVRQGAAIYATLPAELRDVRSDSALAFADTMRHRS